MIIYVSPTKQEITNSQPTQFDDLMSQIMLIDGINLNNETGQKGFPAPELLAVEVVKSGVLTKLADVIGGWLIKDRSRSLRLKIGNNELEVKGLSEAEHKELIKWFQIQAGLHLS